MTNRISLTPEMAKKLGLDLRVGDDVAIMLKGKVSGMGDSTVVEVEDVRGSMADSAMVNEYGEKDHSKVARAFRLAKRESERRESERADNAGEEGDGEDSTGGGEERAGEAEGA